MSVAHGCRIFSSMIHTVPLLAIIAAFKDSQVKRALHRLRLALDLRIRLLIIPKGVRCELRAMLTTAFASVTMFLERVSTLQEKAKTPAMPVAGVFFCYFLLSHHSKSTAMRATISGASNGSQM